MHSVNVVCHEFFVILSFFACITGLILLWDTKQRKTEMEESELILFRMSFCYWLMYCIAFGIEKILLPEWEWLLMSLRITSGLSYLFTFCCVVSLPLHKLAVHQIEE